MSDRLQALVVRETTHAFGRLRYGAWVSSKNRYIYIETPKAACSRVKRTLQLLEGHPLPDDPQEIHKREKYGFESLPSLYEFDPAEASEMLTSPDWFLFAFVRNPYARLLSAFRSKILSGDPEHANTRDAIRGTFGYPEPPGPEDRVGFADFVSLVELLSDDLRDPHWRSQTKLLMVPELEYDFVGRFETFDSDFRNILRRFGASDQILSTVTEKVNESRYFPAPLALGRDIASRIYRMYKGDFVAWGYERDSWLRM